FLTAPPTPAIYTLSLHDALPISRLDQKLFKIKPAVSKRSFRFRPCHRQASLQLQRGIRKAHTFASTAGGRLDHHRVADFFGQLGDRKSTRLNSSHDQISYAVFCL